MQPFSTKGTLGHLAGDGIIDFGVGLAQGYATIGGIGFDRFWQCTVIGPVTNLAARLCQAADDGQILVSKRFLGPMQGEIFGTEDLGKVTLKGISGQIEVFNVTNAVASAETAPIPLKKAA